MNIKELLELRGLDTSARVKMMRHLSRDYDVYDMYRRGHFEVYQSFQGTRNLECDYLVSFLGIRHGCARFVGVYRVGERRPAGETALPPDYPYPEFTTDATYWYDLERENGYEDLVDRVVIDWGASERSWHQKLSAKEVVEVLPKGYVKDFPGLLELSLSYDELREVMGNPAANRQWHQMLSSVAGVYLILDTVTGKQYVGSAYGTGGILSRWKSYAETCHGNNVILRTLVGSNREYARQFRFTILQVLTKSTTREEAIQWETRFKNKLGTRAFGLNGN